MHANWRVKRKSTNYCHVSLALVMLTQPDQSFIIALESLPLESSIEAIPAGTIFAVAIAHANQKNPGAPRPGADLRE